MTTKDNIYSFKLATHLFENIMDWKMGHGPGLWVSGLFAFYSDYLSLDSAEANSFSILYVLEKNKNKQKDAGVDILFMNGIKLGRWNLLGNTTSSLFQAFDVFLSKYYLVTNQTSPFL